MPEFDADRFAEAKYVDYLTDLQTAYKNAFDRMNDRYDSKLVHAIDQEVLNESEPFYEGDGRFRLEVPEDPHGRVTSVVVGEEKFAGVLAAYRETVEREIARQFGFDPDEGSATAAE
ncbi:DUF5783 family protein [Haloglomus litoreum]|uniref:DUF5783 family protein n=1 Tax=Haloglomus litoreum TaxID=3034026 RepID=UPI0023E8474E|nr:DUF5783 family protein [Haloglomus sp. DT116]